MTIFDFQVFKRSPRLICRVPNKQSTWPLLFISFGVTFVISPIVFAALKWLRLAHHPFLLMTRPFNMSTSLLYLKHALWVLPVAYSFFQ